MANCKSEAENSLVDGVLDNLESIGYEGPLLEEGALYNVLEEGLLSSMFIELLCRVCGELKLSLVLQEAVTPPQGVDDHEAFQLELRGFLCELKFPQLDVIEGLGLTFLSSFRNRLLVLDFLVSELMATRLLLLRQSKEQVMETSDSECGGVAATLSAILKLYGFNKPPATVTVRHIFERLISKTRQIISSLPEDHLGRSMVTQGLSQDQWATLDQINEALTQEYAVRREMLLTRADVTVQSLSWSDKAKVRQDEFTRVYRDRREGVQVAAPVDIARVLAAKNDLLTIRKTSHQSERMATQTSINKAVIVGKVPDRGGRPRATRPPPEMPVFKKRTEVLQEQLIQGDGGGAGRGGGKDPKGRVQGGGGWGHQDKMTGVQLTATTERLLEEQYIKELSEVLLKSRKHIEVLTKKNLEMENMLSENNVKIQVMAQVLEKQDLEFQKILAEKDAAIRDMTMQLVQCRLEKKKKIQILKNEIDIKNAAIHEMEEAYETELKSLSDTICVKNTTIQYTNEEVDDLAAKLKEYEKLHDSAWLEVSKTSMLWKIERSTIKKIPQKEIGVGAWGKVLSGHYQGEPVAIKYAHRGVLEIHGTVDMIKREVSIMAHIQHPNLVRFIGAVLDDAVDSKKDVPIIVLELLDMNLRTAYTKERLDKITVVSIFCDVAYGLHYLHEQSTPIIHRDVSAPNILLKRLPNQSFKAKVSDFGSANLAKQSKTAGAGAIIYTAPEMFPQEDITADPPEQTVMVDVFSYGIVLLEVVTKEMPVIEKRSLLLRSCKQEWEQIHGLVIRCTKRAPADRPKMRDILNSLNRFPHV